MDIIEVKQTISKTVPLFTNGPLVKGQKYQWITAHGYGQKANHMINKWDIFDPAEHRVIALEGSNRFYFTGFGGIDVAHWMTSRYRLDDIRDNHDYFDKIFGEYIDPDAVKIVFGFSQGGTTFWRWLQDRQPDFDVFISYAGWFPEDVRFDHLGDYFSDKTLVYTIGSRDRFLNEDKKKTFAQLIEDAQLDLKVLRHEGEHKIDRPILQQIFDQYIKR